MKYPVAERFFSPQGEGVFAGTPMAFIRLVGCSVGKGICTHCDTDFERIQERLGGGLYTPSDLVEWAGEYEHICITGGEPLDRDLQPLIAAFGAFHRVHIETSGTRQVDHAQLLSGGGQDPWITISPKPGYDEKNFFWADELKIIVGGLGDGPGWPTIEDALRWADALHIPVYIQPRNHKTNIDEHNLYEAVELVRQHPKLRLSVQLHKFIHER